jgi:transposase InsO family protein
MDQFILGASALVFLGLVESVITIAVTDRGSPYVAKRVDRWCRLLFPLSFAALIAVVFTQ